MGKRIAKMVDAAKTKSFVADPKNGKPIDVTDPRVNRALQKSGSEYSSGTIRDGIGSRLFDAAYDRMTRKR